MNYWYALYTKPQKENVVEQLLGLRGHATYLPMLPRVQRGRRLTTLEPLFPCYLFVNVDLEQVDFRSIRWIPGLRDVVSGAGGPARVDDAVVEHIRHRLAQKEIRRSAAHQQFKPDERVRLKGYPFDDLDAVFERYLPGEARARVLVHILGRVTPAEVDVDALEKASSLRVAVA